MILSTVKHIYKLESLNQVSSARKTRAARRRPPAMPNMGSRKCSRLRGFRGGSSTTTRTSLELVTGEWLSE